MEKCVLRIYGEEMRFVIEMFIAQICGKILNFILQTDVGKAAGQ